MLKRPLAPFSDQAFALLRIFAGFMFACHGAQKHLGLFQDPAHPMKDLPPQMMIGGWIELVGGLLIMLGLFTRTAAFIASGQMAVAYFQFHWKFAFDQNFFPIVNHGEPAVLYCFIFLAIGKKFWSNANFQ